MKITARLKKLPILSSVAAAIAIAAGGCAANADSAKSDAKTAENGDKLDVMCVYYPHWHTYPYGEKWLGKGWTEWEFVKTAIPRFKGHKLPYVPLPGYLDGKNPADVAKEIDLASNAGITVFLYDWYWYGGKRTMEESLEQGFLKAPNRDKMKFAIMWAYHDRANGFRPEPTAPRANLMTLARTEEDFLEMLDYCIKNYFKRPEYYTVDGRPFYSMYNALNFVKDYGGAAKVKKMFDKAAERMRKNGLPPVCWNAMIDSSDPVGAAKLLAEAGFENATRYNINAYHEAFFDKKRDGLFYEYADAVPAHKKFAEMMKQAPISYIPVATMGWDSSQRCRATAQFPWVEGATYPYGPIFKNNNPDLFEKILKDAKHYAQYSHPKAILINAWNEYTEGSYLLPDIREGDHYLRAIASVFGRRPANEYIYFDCATKKQCKVRAADFENVSYGSHYKNKVDVWLPKNAKNKTPAVVYFHGGGWTTGAMEDRFVEKSLDKLLDKGVAVICADYRYLQDAEDADIFPPVSATMADCAAAVKFVKQNAARWNIDPEKIAVSGGSAGACSALYLGFSGAAGKIAAVGVNVPQTSLDPAEMKSWIADIDYGQRAFGYKSFAEFLANREKALPSIQKYSPAYLAKNVEKAKTPSLVILQNEGLKDAVHSPVFCEKFAEICADRKIDCKLETKGSDKMFTDIADFLLGLK